MNIIIRTIVMVFIVVVCHDAIARGCSASLDGPEIDNVNMGKIFVQRDQPIGSVILKKVVVGNGQELASCGDERFIKQIRLINVSRVSGFPHIYSSGVTGIGINIKTEGKDIDATEPLTIEHGVDKYISNNVYIITFIKTGRIIPGGFNLGDVLEERVSSGEGSWNSVRKVRLSGGSVGQMSCNVLTPDIVVPMGNVSSRFFKHKGATGDWHEFKIGLDCDYGARVSVVVDKAIHTNNVSFDSMKGVIAGIPGDGMAAGIGVQIFNDTHPVEFGNLIEMKPVSEDGPFAIPFRARYYQTDKTVTPGEIRAIANFTVKYQ